jgi:hypothetical protein
VLSGRVEAVEIFILSVSSESIPISPILSDLGVGYPFVKYSLRYIYSSLLRGKSHASEFDRILTVTTGGGLSKVFCSP